MDATEATLSVGVRQLCCRLGIAGRSFARSVENLQQAAQIRMSEEWFRQVVEGEGQAVLKVSRQEQLEIDWSAAQCKTTAANGQEVSRLYVSADGVLVPTTTAAEKQKRRATVRARRQKMSRRQRQRLLPLEPVKKGSDQRYKQVYVTALYDQSQEHRLVGLTRHDHRGLGRLLRREAARVRLRGAQERVGLVDGAVCLRRHLEVLPLQAVVLDFYHLAEHVKTAQEQTQTSPAWSDPVLHEVRHEGYEPFFDQLVNWRGRQRGGKRKIANRLLHYVAQRQAMIRYDECDKRGWDVGSGPMESMCGVTTDRIKGRGRRWDLENAEAVMALEALYQSHQWDQYWTRVLSHWN